MTLVYPRGQALETSLASLPRLNRVLVLMQSVTFSGLEIFQHHLTVRCWLSATAGLLPAQATNF